MMQLPFVQISSMPTLSHRESVQHGS